MRAMVCDSFGPPENLVLREMPGPVPAAGQVLIEVHAVGVNFTDVLSMGGRSQLKRSLPFTPGVEAAGVVMAVGPGVRTVKPGQRVLGTRTDGTYAEEVVFSAEEVFVIPDTMDMPTAATFYVVAMTADYSINQRAKLSPGENLLVLGAGGGAGLAAVEIGKAQGARVVAAASSGQKLELALSRGADAAVLYPPGPLDLAEQKALAAEFLQHAQRDKSDGLSIGDISTVHDSRGYHVIFDGVGGTYTEPALRSLGWQGRYLAVGFAAGVPNVSLGPLLFKDANIMGIQPGDDNVRLPARSPERMAKFYQWFRRGLLRPQITRTFPMEEAAGVLRLMADRKISGRVVLITSRAQA
jgi:NADPH:quinone reductase